jgi:type I restriction enzyme, S subunit
MPATVGKRPRISCASFPDFPNFPAATHRRGITGPRLWRATPFGVQFTATQPSLNRNYIYSIPVFFPEPKEQQAIACILGALDDKIELNRRMNRTLEGLARALFQSWFVDFDPVRAKAAGQSPPGLAPNIAALFPEALVDSDLGDIPEGWRSGTVDEFAEINARTLGRGDTLEMIDYIEISEVMRGEVATITRYARGDEPSRARRRLQHGDTALSTVRPDRGAYFLCLNPSDSLIASTGFAVLSSRTSDWAFLHAMVTRGEIGEELGRLADGGAYPAVRPEVIAKLPVVIPGNPKVIVAYDRLAQPLLQRSEVNRGESRATAALRDALLPKLISGELRVPDAERIVGRCV